MDLKPEFEAGYVFKDCDDIKLAMQAAAECAKNGTKACKDEEAQLKKSLSSLKLIQELERNLNLTNYTKNSRPTCTLVRTTPKA